VNIRIIGPCFVAVITQDDVIGLKDSNVPPIIKYMRDWPLIQIQKYCLSRQWRMEVLDDEENILHLDH